MIPAAKKGKFEVRYRDGVCELMEGRHLWMDLSEREKKTHSKAIKDAFGNVLIGGLGLGYVVEEMAKKQKVTAITVIEISQDVIDLVAPHIVKSKVQIIKADVFEFLETCDRYDYIYGDVWPSGHDKWNNLKEKFRRLALQKSRHVFLWNGQKTKERKS